MEKLALVLCAITCCFLYNHSERINNPNEMVRVHTVVALVEQGSYGIARRTVDGEAVADGGPVFDRFGKVHDTAIVCDDAAARAPSCRGTLYAAKAPGLSWLGVPVYWLQGRMMQMLGAGRPSRAAIVWALRFFCVVLPTLLAWWWLARSLASRLERPQIGIAVVLALALGSLSLTYSQMFASHQPAGLALLATFGCLDRARTRGRRWLLLAGFAAGLAVAIEYPAAGAVLLLVGWQAGSRRSLRDLGWFALGAVAPLALLLHFHTVAFGAPWRLPYAFLEDPAFSVAQSGGVFGIGAPRIESVWGSLLSPETGLHFWAPWSALLWLGVLSFRGGALAAVRLPFLICLYFLAVQFGYRVWRGGWVVGPRHLTAMMPFAALVVARLLDGIAPRARRPLAFAFAASAAAAIVTTGLASLVSQGFPEQFHNPLREAVGPLLACGYVAANPLMWLGVPGPWSAAPYLAALATGAVVLAWLAIGPGRRRALTTGAALLCAGVLVAGLWRIGPGRTATTDAELVRLMRDWSPPHPPGSCVPTMR